MAKWLRVDGQLLRVRFSICIQTPFTRFAFSKIFCISLSLRSYVYKRIGEILSVDFVHTIFARRSARVKLLRVRTFRVGPLVSFSMLLLSDGTGPRMKKKKKPTHLILPMGIKFLGRNESH